MHEVTLQTVLQDFSAGEEGARRVVRLVREELAKLPQGNRQ